jgi:hypothetical protein
MAFSVNLGPCSACHKAPADFRIGSRTCEACGAIYDQMCSTCAKKFCRKCHKGKLAVEPQEVVLGQAETTDWWLGFQASMWPVPVVAMKPGEQLC